MTEEEFLIIFSKIMYSLRWEHRLTQKEVSRITKISPEMISKMENGEIYPRLAHCYKIATAFKMTVTEFFNEVETGEILSVKKKRKHTSPYTY